METLRHLTIEETYELADALLQNDLKGIEEEVGDLLLHTVFYAKLGSETGDFDITTILDKICDKLVHRHPHIYGDVTVKDDQEVMQNWEQLKLKEKEGTENNSVLSGVPVSLPAMIKAYRMQEKTKQVGFEWENKDQVWEKVEEEMSELKKAIHEENDPDRIEDEMGDVFFSLINYSRFLKIDPETALEKVNKKFKRRFQYIEEHATKDLTEMTLGEMDALWNQAKNN
jgi:XTP/dITP diphosphohydrolase